MPKKLKNRRKIINNPEIIYLEAGYHKYTFQVKKIKKIIESECHGLVLNLFAGKTRLNVTEIRVDLSSEFKPDFNLDAGDFLEIAISQNLTYGTIIYDPPWNERKSKEFYEGRYVGKFAKLKDDIVKVLAPKGRIISVGYEISNFGKKRDFELVKLYVINSFGEIRPYFISIEQKHKCPTIQEYIHHPEQASTNTIVESLK